MAEARTWRMRMFTDLSPGYTLEDENGVPIPDEMTDLTDRQLAIMHLVVSSEILLHLRSMTGEQFSEHDISEVMT